MFLWFLGLDLMLSDLILIDLMNSNSGRVDQCPNDAGICFYLVF